MRVYVGKEAKRDRQTGKAAAELWKQLRGPSAAVLRARAQVDACAYVDVLYGDEEQHRAHTLPLKYLDM